MTNISDLIKNCSRIRCVICKIYHPVTIVTRRIGIDTRGQEIDRKKHVRIAGGSIYSIFAPFISNETGDLVMNCYDNILR